jgi:hypothetical protein
MAKGRPPTAMRSLVTATNGGRASRCPACWPRRGAGQRCVRTAPIPAEDLGAERVELLGYEDSG